jgi:hypothetical protein
MSNLQVITVGGVDYYGFLIDVNESGAKDISIDSVQLYTSDGSKSAVTALSGATLRFDIDATTGGAGDTTLLYSAVNAGSGQADLGFFIPTSAFLGVSSNDYFYLYEHFGSYGSTNSEYASDGGYEETSMASATTTFVPVPETNVIAPLLAVLGVVVAGPFVRRSFNP